MRNPQIANKSIDNIFTSAINYREVDVSAADYIPDAPFKGIVVGGDGDVAIVGIDGNSVVLTLVAGVYPLGGRSILTTGTTATGLVALS